MVALSLLIPLALAQEPPPEEPPAADDAPVVEAVPVVAAPADLVTPAPRFASDEEVRIQEPAEDLFAAGERVWVEAPVGDNAFLAGDKVYIQSAIDGDLFAAGGEVHIDAPVHGDVYVGGGEVTVGPEGRVDGHMLVGTGALRLEGPLRGTLRVGAGEVTVDAPIGGDVQMEAGALVFGDAGRVGGDLDYATPEPTAGVDERVDGVVRWTRSENKDLEDFAEHEEPASPVLSVAGWALHTGWSYLAKLIVGVALVLLGGQAASRASRVLVEQPSRSLGFGLAGFVLLPLLSVMACVLIIPFPLGLLGMTAFAALLYVSQIIAAQALGDELLRRVKPGVWGSPLVSLAVGLLPLVLLTSLPWVGSLVWFVATVLGGGAIWLRLRELARA
ncbi:MAG: polymer-forming cytoskeletal protein [Alphaproteobacteria bacterium]|nr:polymer-forming cytoskeletal protein [Alphaproteobacteria bacterium]